VRSSAHPASASIFVAAARRVVVGSAADSVADSGAVEVGAVFAAVVAFVVAVAAAVAVEPLAAGKAEGTGRA